MKKYSDKRIYTIENRLYLVGLVFFVLFVIGFIIVKLLNLSLADIRHCMFNEATGYCCPGCGGTRAFLSFVHGDIIKCVYYHPVVAYTGIIYILFMVSHTLEKLENLIYIKKHGKNKQKCIIKGLKFRNWYLYAVLVILLINVTVRNIIIWLG